MTLAWNGMMARTDPPMPLRYAVLHHTGQGPSHYDLLFETSPGSPLLTYRSPAWPISGAVQLERIGDHRVVYLDYEGPVGGGRGEVRAVARGTYDRSGDDRAFVITFRTGTTHPPLVIQPTGRAAPAGNGSP